MVKDRSNNTYTISTSEHSPSPLLMLSPSLLRPTDLTDLKQFHPSAGANLESLLTYEGDDFEDTFSLTFEVWREGEREGGRQERRKTGKGEWMSTHVYMFAFKCRSIHMYMQVCTHFLHVRV